MKHLAILLALLLVTSSASAQKEKKSNVYSSAGSAARSQSELNLLLTEQQKKIQQVLNDVEWTPKIEPARQMTKEQHDLEVEWSKWLLDVRNRLKAHATDIGVLLKKKLSEEEMVQKMTAMNLQFQVLQEATQMESRKYQTLSNASKSRHEMAMNAIRNIK
ncbi:MAG TPA: hypothetical protein VFH43_12995 [Candidatus Kapabacteria bacterium]|nr:hypothetical protein [Candidatus Kapabacteria bacterium]